MLLSENYWGDNYISVHSHIKRKYASLRLAFRTKSDWFLSVKKNPSWKYINEKKNFDKLLFF